VKNLVKTTFLRWMGSNGCGTNGKTLRVRYPAAISPEERGLQVNYAVVFPHMVLTGTPAFGKVKIRVSQGSSITLKNINMNFT